jgi:hypothetical protein
MITIIGPPEQIGNMLLRKDKNNLYIKRLALQELLYIRDWKLLVLSKYISYKMFFVEKNIFLRSLFFH